eukprot:13612067-Alexandrium_andersonii.AAC.1
MATFASGSVAATRPYTALHGELPFTEMSALPTSTHSGKIWSKGRFSPSRLSCSDVRWITSRRRAVLLSMWATCWPGSHGAN